MPDSTAPDGATLRVGAELEVLVDRVEPQGLALACVGARTLRVHGGVPGDRLRVRVARKVRRTFEAVVLDVLEASPLRVDPRCRFFGHCGGCRRQNLLYSAQLDLKRQAVEDAFTNHADYPACGVPEVVAAPNVYEYRNKMEFSFGARRWLTDFEIASGEPLRKDFALGLHLPLHFDRVVDLTECHLQSGRSAQVVNAVRDLALREGWAPWSTRTHEGFLRHLGLRVSARCDEFMVNLVTSREDPERIDRLAAMLRSEFPEVTTLVQTINSGLAQVATGERVITVFGPGVIHDRIGRHTFEIGPHSFFQTNTLQAERLYEVAREFAGLGRDDVVYDLFCGVGTIALFLAENARSVVGLELDAAAVESARRNAAANAVTNVAFVQGDIADLLGTALAERFGAPDVVVLDPPRAGCHPKVLRRLGELRPERLIYVSCNPVTQAKDIAVLRDAYTVERMQPVDLFPHTDHVENVAALRARPLPF